MKRSLIALVVLLLSVGFAGAQDSATSREVNDLANSTAVVSVDSNGNVGGDFTNGFFPSELLEVVWIDAPKHGTVDYDFENHLVSYQPGSANTDELDEFTIYAMDSEQSWNITRCFFDPTTSELVFSTKVLNGSFEGASFDSFGQLKFCSLVSNGSCRRDGWTQFWGGVKLVGGLVETGGGVIIGVGASWTGVGAVAGGGIAVHGLDNVQAGIRQLWSGEEVRTYTSQGVSSTAHHAFGVDEDKAILIGEVVDAGLGVFGGVGTAAKGPQLIEKCGDLFQLSARTRLALAGAGTLDDTIDISSDVSKIVKLGGTISGGVQNGRGAKELEQLFSHNVPDEFGSLPKGITTKWTPPSVRKAVNSDIVHASERAVERGVFPDTKSAADALRELGKKFKTEGLPPGTIPDPKRPDSVLVPFGDGHAVYEITKKGTAILRTVLGGG